MTASTVEIADVSGKFGLDPDHAEEFGLLELSPSDRDRRQRFGALPLSRRWKRNPVRWTHADGRSEWIFDAAHEVNGRG